MNKVACAVLVFDRPQYFAPVLESLKENADGNDVAWFFFVDGAKTAAGRVVGDEKKIKESTHLISQKFPPFPYHIEISSINEGIARQKQKAHQLFTRYDQIIFFEDDMIISPYYINLVINMQNQFPNDIVYAPAKPSANIEQRAKLNQVRDITEHLWGYSMRRDSFLKIKDKFDAYCADIGDCYKNRDDAFLIKKYNLGGASSHDSMIEKTCGRLGIRKLCARVPRGKYIGRKGLHQLPEKYDAAGFAEDRKYIFEEDRTLKHFEIIGAQKTAKD